jgi:ketopantoate reductase
MDSLRRKLLWCPMPAAITRLSWSRSRVISWPQHVPVLPAWPGSQPSFPGQQPGRPGCRRRRPARRRLSGVPRRRRVLAGGTAGYVRILRQPTALQETPDPRLAGLESDLTGRGFAVQRVADMDGWLAFHAAFVACITAALCRCGTDPVRLAADRPALTLMCRAITEAFAALRAGGTAGLPRNLAVLRSPLLRVAAVRYWARTMRSPKGELCFAAHARNAEAEMRALARDVAARITS